MTDDVVVVEDDLHVRELLVRRLEIQGYAVTEFADGRECWEWLQRTGSLPDGILLDVMLPGLDGFALLKRLDAPPYEKITVMMVTACATESETVRAFELGADDHVSKPFSPSELCARLDRRL